MQGMPAFVGLLARRRTVVGAAAALAGWFVAPVPGGGSAAFAQATITALGDLPGGAFQSQATAVSDDGSVVVGAGSTSVAIGREGFRWTAGGGMVGLGMLAPGYSNAYGVSGDGSLTVGFTTAGSGLEAYRHTTGGGMVPLPQFNNGSDTEAWDVNGDGSVIVGEGNGGGGRHGFRWTSVGGFVAIPDLTGTNTTIRGVSKDGNVTVGASVASDFVTTEALRHTVAGGSVGLGDLPGGATSSIAFGANADGSVVVGNGNSASGQEAFRWTQAGGMVGLGDLSGGAFSSVANDVSDDGLTIVGAATDAGGAEAFYWTTVGGMQSLTALLTSRGADPAASGWTELTSATAVSGDGRYVAGYGIHNGNTEAFVALVPEPTSVGLAVFAGCATLLRRRRGA